MANPLKKIYGGGADKKARKDGTATSNGSAPSGIPDEVLEEVEGAFRAIAGMEPIWQQAMAFYNNDQHVFISAVSNTVDRMETREGGAKPAHRPRLQANRLTMQVVGEASMLTGRRPAFEVTAPNHDPAKRNQARLAEQVLIAEYQRLQLDVVALETVIQAINTGAGFVWPYWDTTYGKWLGDVDGEDLYLGDIRAWVLHQGEVAWEEGVEFKDSRWVCIRKARSPKAIQNRDGYTGPAELPPDATSGRWERPGDSKKGLCFEYDFLEKPCKEYANGRWLTWVGKHATRKQEDYPRASGGPALHMLPWIPQPGKHRALGAGEQLVDIQRMINRIGNQIIAWRNLILRPQMLAAKGSIEQDPTDEDGVIYEYNPVGGNAPTFREVPEIPQSLFQDLDRCYEQMDHILGQQELPPGLEAASAIEAADGRQQSARGIFVTNLASWWEGLGHHILEIVHERYTEPRLLEVQGRRGVELVEDFVGHKIGRPGSVRVSESSIEPRTKQSMEARIMVFAANGWIDGHQAMAAINGGTAAALIDSYELDVQRQYREINEIEALGDWSPEVEYQRAAELWVASGNPVATMPESMWAQPPVPFAEDYDDHQVHIDVLSQWMKTREFELLPDLAKQAARNHLQQHQMLVQAEMAEAAMQMNAMAEQRGMKAATKPEPPKQLGDEKHEAGAKTQLAGGDIK